jgi:alkaline phosphatase
VPHLARATLLIKFYYRLISDAAASATAYACGLKTKNRRVGIDADGNYCGTLLEAAKKKGMRTAIVSSATSLLRRVLLSFHTWLIVVTLLISVRTINF